MRWLEPHLLLLLWLIPILALLSWVAAAARGRQESRLGDRNSLRALTGESGWRAIRSTLLLAALTSGILALARPQSGFRLVQTASRGADVVVALDVSLSMTARDVRPDRLGAARREILALLTRLEGSRIGLVAFAGAARVASPLSTDREGIASRVETAGAPDAPHPGSDLGAGLRSAAQLLRRPGDDPRAIVLLSDGEHLSGDVAAGLHAVRQAGARLFVIGVGTEDGATIPVLDERGVPRGTKRDASGRTVVTRLDERALRDLAAKAGGSYERGDGTGRAGERLADPIRSTDEHETRCRSIRAYNERYPWLAALAGLLLAAERLVPRRRRP